MQTNQALLGYNSDKQHCLETATLEYNCRWNGDKRCKDGLNTTGVMAYFSKLKMVVFEIQTRDKRTSPPPFSKRALQWFGHCNCLICCCVFPGPHTLWDFSLTYHNNNNKVATSSSYFRALSRMHNISGQYTVAICVSSSWKPYLHSQPLAFQRNCIHNRSSLCCTKKHSIVSLRYIMFEDHIRELGHAQ